MFSSWSGLVRSTDSWKRGAIVIDVHDCTRAKGAESFKEFCESAQRLVAPEDSKPESGRVERARKVIEQKSKGAGAS